MAIYSCNLRSIGRTTHDPGTAGAHIRYISRQEADAHILSGHMPADPVAARTWMDNRERAMRRNARVIDKIRLALPRELTAAQRAELVRDFMADLTDGRIPWYAAIHQTGKDAHNPHAHIAVHDRDIETGKRLLRLSDNARDRTKAGLPGPKAVHWVRERWETVCNAALARAGIEARIDRRTLDAQGAGRMAAIHEGPRARKINNEVRRPESRGRVNGCGRLIDYPSIDAGRTRREFNAHIIDLNIERAARSGDPVKAIWASFEKDQVAEDRKLEERLSAERRQRTAEFRKAARSSVLRLATLREQHHARLGPAVEAVRDSYREKRRNIQQRHTEERRALKDRQSRLHIRIFALLDLTGITRRRQQAARKNLSSSHKKDRAAFSQDYRRARAAVEAAENKHYRGAASLEQSKKQARLSALRSAHRHGDKAADLERQQREIEREHLRMITEGKVNAWKNRDAQDPTRANEGFMRAIRRASRQETGRKGISEDRERD